MSELVSILIPTYNREKLIRETLKSAAEQTYDALEIVVVDNASTDSTWTIISEAARKDTRIRAFRNETNIGPVRNWLACAEQARGKYAKILWSDDLLHPRFLELTVPPLSDPTVGFSYSAVSIFEDGAQPSQGKPHYDTLEDGNHASSVFINGALLCGPFPLSPGCALFRTDDLRKNLWRDVPNRIGSDFKSHAIGNDLLLFLLTARDYPRFHTTTQRLAYFRDHSDSISIDSGEGRLILHYDMVRAMFAQRFLDDPALRRKLNFLLLVHQRRYDGARYGIRQVSDFYPDPIRIAIDPLFAAKRLLRRLIRKS